MTKMKTVQMPKWVAACLVISALASLTLAFAQLTGYTLVKPYTVTITTAPSPLQVQTVSFTFDPALNRWTSCNININNTQASPVSATIYVYLKDSAQQTIAQGQHTQNFNPGATVVTVTLVWTSGTASDVAGGYIVVQP